MSLPYDQIADRNGFIRATVRLFTSEEGGRQTPVGPDYRANWSIDMPDASKQSGAPMVTDNVECLALGDSTAVRLFPMWPPFWMAVVPGSRLFAFEGAKAVGMAIVTEVVPPTSKQG